MIRPARASEIAAVERFVWSVAGEVYGHLFQGDPPRPDGNWAQSLLAEVDGRIIGVVATDDDWIEDLWVAADCRDWSRPSRPARWPGGTIKRRPCSGSSGTAC